MLISQCDDNDKCMRCIQVADSAIVYKLPCYRESIDKIVPFRAGKNIKMPLKLNYIASRYLCSTGNSRQNQTRSKLPQLSWDSRDQQVRVISVQYPFQQSVWHQAPELSLTCRKFVPKEGEHILVDTWEGENGKKLRLEFPPFACVKSQFIYLPHLANQRQYDVDSAKSQFQQYIDKCADLFDADLAAIDSDPLVSLTMTEAVRYANAHRVLIS